MPLHAAVEPDADRFRAKVWPFLAADPVRRTLPMTVLDAVVAGVYADALLASVTDDDGAVVACTVQTPPHPLIVASTSSEAVAAVIDVLPAGHELPGIVGLDPWADEAAARWCASRRVEARVGHRQRLFRLDALVVPRPAAGRSRPATTDDVDLLVAWGAAFMAEAGIDAPGPTPATLRPRLAEGQIHVWVDGDGRPASYAARGRLLEAHARIGPVYTPPELRGRGFASNLTAAVSQTIMDEGGVPVLFTDLANRTSNGIYQAIGYVPVADATEIRLTPSV